MENGHTDARYSHRNARTPFASASRVFQDCATFAAEMGGPLWPVASQLRMATERLGQPMRLAVVGQIKRGKSTLVNALLGEQIAATGQLELTFTVSEFCHADDRSVFIHYKDGTSEGPLPPAALEGLTVRNSARVDQLRQIRKVEFTMPNDLLKTFRLVDTPGLGSIHRIDSQNTSDFLGVSAFAGEEEHSAMQEALVAMGRTTYDVHDDSVREIDGADAILYLFSGGMHENDYTTVAQFLGQARGSVTPLRAFGVLSRCDQYWPPGRDLPGSPDPMTYDPMAAADKIAERYLAEPGIRRLLFTVVPVAGLVGIGARLITDEEFCWLDDLSKVEPDLLVRRLRDVAWFATAEQLPGVSLPVAMRQRLVCLLGGWGTHLACGYLRDRLGVEEIRDRLVADSGVARLHGLIASHFGNRASIIKLDHGIQDATVAIGRCRLKIQQVGGQVPKAVGIVAERLEALRISESGRTAELSVLSALYNAELTLRKDERAELLAVTGEYGTTFAASLGLPEDTSLPDLAAAAKRLAEKWAYKEQDPTLDRATLRATRTIRQSYERIAYQTGQAQHSPGRSDEPTAGTR